LKGAKNQKKASRSCNPSMNHIIEWCFVHEGFGKRLLLSS